MKDEMRVLSHEEITEVGGGESDFFLLLALTASLVGTMCWAAILIHLSGCKCKKENEIDQNTQNFA